MSVHPAVADPSARQPDMHLVVPPPGHEAAIEAALKNDAERPVLGWRRAAHCLRLLSDDDLNEALLEALHAGHKVTVWHGSTDWRPQAMVVRLGKDYEKYSGRLLWARLSAPEDASTPQTWEPLAEQIDLPDDPDLRLFLNSEEQTLPRWALEETLCTQGHAALRAWVDQHLTPRFALWDEDDTSVTVAPNANHDPMAWPWQRLPVWEGEAWLPESGTTTVAHTGAPANDAYLVLSAQKAGTGKGKPQTWVSVLHPLDSDDQWEAEHLGQAQSKKTLSVDQDVGSSATVKITRHADAPDTSYGVWISLPSEAGSASEPKKWCLWLHPRNRMPLPLEFQPQGNSQWHLVEWPTSADPADPCFQPSAVLWEDICKGSVSLERLDAAVPSART